jgi:hypothetical protein
MVPAEMLVDSLDRTPETHVLMPKVGAAFSPEKNCRLYPAHIAAQRNKLNRSARLTTESA